MADDSEIDRPADIPIEQVYEAGSDIPLNPVDMLYTAQQEQWETVKFEEITAEDDVRAALVSASMQFHYIYLSQLIVLGDVVMNAEQTAVKRLASFLAASRMRDVDAWGRYLAALGERATISKAVQTYCNRMYQDDSRLSRLMGVIFADVFRQAVGTNTVDFPDPTFGRLMERDIEEGDRNVELTRSYLQRINRNLDANEQSAVIMQIDRYAALIDDIVDENEDVFAQIGVETDRVHEQVSAAIDSFHDTVREQ